MKKTPDNLSIIVVGASGDLARKKIIPAFFALYCQGLLPPMFNLFGFARTPFSHDQFRDRIRENLTCRYTPNHDCTERMNEFLARCYYAQGEYGAADSFLDLFEELQTVECRRETNRLFYLAVPSTIFAETARAMANAGFVQCDAHDPWSRVVVEKPFGADRESSDRLGSELAKVFVEEQIYRIDHYLGKEVVQNLMVLRFANLIFEPIWNAKFIKDVQITWKEVSGVEERGGYFDGYGIIRDVMQNHLIQILSLIAMEPPLRMDATCVRDEKVKVLRVVGPLRLDDVVIGQYSGGERGGRRYPAYREEKGVPSDSLTPTYAAAAFQIHNTRWEGVPFLIRAGKALHEKRTEIRIQFRDLPGNLFPEAGGMPAANELTIQVQPDEDIRFTIVNKVPGLELKLAPRDLDLHYKAVFSEAIPEAYESLLLDVITGDKGLFIRQDELAAAWDIFTPVLHEMDRRGLTPELYPSFSQGPVSVDTLAARIGVRKG